jgi:hypothetical protein
MSQGEFSDAAAGKAAVEALVAAGVARDKIHTWNIIPESAPEAGGPSRAARGAKVGFIVGGVTGAAIGGTVGAGLDAMTDNHVPMPQPRGVRVVVDEAPASVDVREVLRKAGAVNVQ